MIQDLYQKTIKFSGIKHHNQKVPDSKANYLVHISNVTMEIFVAYHYEPTFDINFAIQVAILHDVLEDTNTTPKELTVNFGSKITKAVQALTKDASIKDKEEKMIDSLQRINRLSKEVGIVKLADRITNLQAPPKTWNNEKIARYHNISLVLIEYLKGKNDYLFNRFLQKIEAYKKYF